MSRISVEPGFDVAVGDVFDLRLGVPQGHRYQAGIAEWIRLKCIDRFIGPEESITPPQRVTLKPIGGGPTNVPAWDYSIWTPLVYDLWEVQSKIRGGVLTRVEQNGR